MTEILTPERDAHLVSVGVLAPEGECMICDRRREYWKEKMFPMHRVKARCNNAPEAREPHCTCDACW